jgi:ribosomal-protein-alanine N-acetyltransferase
MFTDHSLTFETKRLRLEPLRITHASALQRIFWDPELYHFVPEDPPTEAELIERLEKWAKRASPDGKEIWLNWIAYDLDTEEVVAHFQATVKPDHSAAVAYLVPRIHQKKGYAHEGLSAVIQFLKKASSTKIVRAWIDTRNEDSIKLVEKIGMIRGKFLKDADFFKGATSDEWIYEMEIK